LALPPPPLPTERIKTKRKLRGVEAIEDHTKSEGPFSSFPQCLKYYRLGMERLKDARKTGKRSKNIQR
jgi:hypothetical protein